MSLGGVRWYLEWEQIDQLNTISIIWIVEVVLPQTEKEKISQASIKSMRKWSQSQYLPRLIVECAAVSEVGRQFCIATYGAEGDSELAITVYLIFNDLDKFYNDRDSVFPQGSMTRKRCKEAAKLVNSKWEKLKDDVESYQGNVEFLEGE